MKLNVSSSGLRYQGRVADSATVSSSSQSSRHLVPVTSSLRPIAVSANLMKTRKPPELTPKQRGHYKVDQLSPNSIELQRFNAEPTVPVIPENFAAPVAPATRTTLPITTVRSNHDLLSLRGCIDETNPSKPLRIFSTFQVINQQNINLTSAQNRIQNELQRKHEELQQLIVHQQEELKRVSEQLFIARYGISSPLISVSCFALNYSQLFLRNYSRGSNTSRFVRSLSKLIPIPITTVTNAEPELFF